MVHRRVGTRSLSSGRPKAGPVGFAHPTTNLSSVIRPLSSALVKLPDSKDFWSGVMLIAIGAVAVFIARDYPFGTALRMGAGFFPVVQGIVLMLFGLYFAVRGVRSSTKIEGNWSL